MRVTRTRVFVEAAIVAIMGFFPDYAMLAGGLAVGMAMLGAALSPKLIPMSPTDLNRHIHTANSEFRYGTPGHGSTLPTAYQIQR